MTREVSHRTSGPPETKGRVSRPDIPGKRDLDPDIVEDRPDPSIVETHLGAIQRGADMDKYVGSINPTEGKTRRPSNAKRK